MKTFSINHIATLKFPQEMVSTELISSAGTDSVDCTSHTLLNSHKKIVIGNNVGVIR